MECLDNKCQCMTDYFFISLYYFFYPIKILCKCINSFFQRPYSFFFVLDFLILITPALLLLIILIQNYEFINSIQTFNKIFYFILLNLIINFIIVFHIYYLYNTHKLEDNFDHGENDNVRSFTIKTLNYLFKFTKLGYIGIYFIFEIIICFICLSHINGTSDYYKDNFDRPIVIQFTKFSIFLNLTFNFLHVGMYTLLYLFLLCKLNESCLCKIILNCTKENSKTNNNLNPKSNPINNNSNTNTNIIINQSYTTSKKVKEIEKKFRFQNLALDFYLFFGLYECKRDTVVRVENN